MIALDTTFLLDYLDGAEATEAFLADRTETPLFAPTLSLFETYRGAARTAGQDGVQRVADGLDWIDPLPLTVAAGREAAALEAELHEAGEPINLGDVLIAGICRDAGATLVTRDGDFDRVPGLETIEY